MRGSFVILSMMVCSLVANSKPCLFKSEPERPYPPKSIQDITEYPRRYSKVHSCKCGVYSKQFPSPFHLFVYLKTGPGNLRTGCIGAILTSNLVALSHRCFQYPNTTLMPYDSWNVENRVGQTIPVRDIVVSTANNAKGVQYPVKEIIFNPQYTLHAPTNPLVPDDDLALLVLDVNLFDKGHYSVCLPYFNKEVIATHPDVFHQKTTYIGMGGELLSQDRTKEVRLVKDVVALKATDCDQEANLGLQPNDDTICVRFRVPPPRREGGLLLVDSVDEKTFLMGLANKIGMKMKGTDLHYAFFTNTFALSTFVDYHAHRQNSVWCKQPSKGFRPKRKITKKLKPNVFPWEALRTPIIRDETLDCVCGVQNKGGKLTRIAGGEEAVPYEFPWAVQLLMGFSSGYSLCGGSLINDRMILTAAHCVAQNNGTTGDISEYVKADNITFLILSHKTLDPNDPNVLQGRITKFFMHPDYISASKHFIIEDDIALLIIERPIPFTPATPTYDKAIRPICLPSVGQERDLVGKQAVVAGWGLLDNKNLSSTPPALKKLSLPILPLGACSTATVAVLTDKNLCAGSLHYSNSSQRGDSGGPLMLQNEEKLWTLVGAVSYAIYGYDEAGFYIGDYTFYANVQKYLTFIDYIADQEKARWCRTTKFDIFPRSAPQN